MDLTSSSQICPEPDSPKDSGNKGLITAKGDGQAGAPPMATIQDDDERLLARIGYKQVSDMLASVRG